MTGSTLNGAVAQLKVFGSALYPNHPHHSVPLTAANRAKFTQFFWLSHMGRVR